MTVMEGTGTQTDPFVRCTFVDKVAPWGVMFRRGMCLRCSGKRKDAVVSDFIRRTLLNRIAFADDTEHPLTKHYDADEAARLLVAEGLAGAVPVRRAQEVVLSAVRSRKLSAASASRLSTALRIADVEV